MSLCKTHADLLKVLIKASKKQRKALLKVADRTWIEAICECALNLVKGNVALSSTERKRLSPYKNHLRALSNPNVTLRRKRKLISQQGGNWLKFLVGPVLKVLEEIF